MCIDSFEANKQMQYFTTRKTSTHSVEDIDVRSEGDCLTPLGLHALICNNLKSCQILKGHAASRVPYVPLFHHDTVFE